MNHLQKRYAAFMESVCNQFNCPEAIPALKKGFQAYCEAFDNTERNGLDWKFSQHDGRPIDEYNDDISTPEMDAIRTDNQTDELIRNAWYRAFNQLKSARTHAFSELNISESTDAHNRFVLEMQYNNAELTFILHTDEPYSIYVHNNSGSLCLVTIPVDIHDNYAQHIARIISTVISCRNSSYIDILKNRGYNVQCC